MISFKNTTDCLFQQEGPKDPSIDVGFATDGQTFSIFITIFSSLSGDHIKILFDNVPEICTQINPPQNVNLYIFNNSTITRSIEIRYPTKTETTKINSPGTLTPEMDTLLNTLTTTACGNSTLVFRNLFQSSSRTVSSSLINEERKKNKCSENYNVNESFANDPNPNTTFVSYPITDLI